MRPHVLDANALYRFLTEGSGAAIVGDIFKQAIAANTPVMMSVVNWGEVYYTMAKRLGLSKADNALAAVLQKTPLTLVGVEPHDAVRAGRLKAQYNLPYADAFAAALTGGQHVLVTADVDHFRRLPKIRLLELPRA